jgi:hypothetical protein
VTGRIVACDDESATVHVDGADQRLPYTGVEKAVVQVEFGEAGA